MAPSFIVQISKLIIASDQAFKQIVRLDRPLGLRVKLIAHSIL